MPNVTVQARVTAELKEDAEEVFAAIGLTTAEAIRIFLQQTVNSGGLPFQPTAKRPSAETEQAISELEDGGGQTFQTTSELFANWKK
jgi:DNA-damage-inducible protein J